jgi:hypothetical protein
MAMIHSVLWIAWGGFALMLAITLLIGRRQMRDEVKRVRKVRPKWSR